MLQPTPPGGFDHRNDASASRRPSWLVPVIVAALVIAVLVSLPISLLVGYLMVNFFRGGFLFFMLIFFLSGAVGGFIGRITKRAIGGRRGRYLPGLVVAMMILGVAIPALPLLLAVLTGNMGGLFALLGPGIYLFVGASAAYWQMR